MRTNTAALYWQRKFGRECRSVKVTTQNAPTICAGARLCHILAEFTKNGTPLSTFIPLRIDLQDMTGQNEYGVFEVRIGLLTLRGYGKYWRLIPKVDEPWWLATPCGTPNCSPDTLGNYYVWFVSTGGSNDGRWYNDSCGVRPVLCFSSALLVSVEDEREAGFSLSDVPLDDLLAEIKSRTEG